MGDPVKTRGFCRLGGLRGEVVSIDIGGSELAGLAGEEIRSGDTVEFHRDLDLYGGYRKEKGAWMLVREDG